jgi:hypothetical protein
MIADEYCLPLESARARLAYKVPGSAVNNFGACDLMLVFNF